MSTKKEVRSEQRSRASSEHAPGDSSPASHQVVIIGGGAAGLAVADQLGKAKPALNVALIEPATYHYDQSAFMQVGGEGMKKEHTRQAEAAFVPPGVTWIQEHALSIDPDARVVELQGGGRVAYSYLVVATGVQVRWDRIQGLNDHLGTQGICSVYGYEHAERTWEMIRAFPGGRAVFTSPSSPYKGGSAPLDLLHRAEQIWEETGVRDRTKIFFTTASAEAFAGPGYAEMIERDAREDDVHVYFGYELTEVRPARKEAVFSVSKGESQSQDVLRYDFIHVVPPMRPPALIKTSHLAHQSGPLRGYLEVDPETLRHRRYDTIFGVGDVAGVEVVKTGEQARQQADAVVQAVRQALSA